MKVSFVNITADPEQTMAYIARVSNPNNQDNENYAGLLRYCIKHQHWSVFEQSSMTLEIETTRGLAAQVLRHRSFTFQEFSQRYADSNLLGEKEEYLKFILLIQNVSEYINSHHVTFQHYSFKIKEIVENNNDINNIISVIDGIKANYESLINEERKFTHFKNVKVNEESTQIIEKISYLFKANIKDHEEILQKYTGKKFNYYHL